MKNQFLFIIKNAIIYNDIRNEVVDFVSNFIQKI